MSRLHSLAKASKVDDRCYYVMLQIRHTYLGLLREFKFDWAIRHKTFKGFLHGSLSFDNGVTFLQRTPEVRPHVNTPTNQSALMFKKLTGTQDSPCPWVQR